MGELILVNLFEDRIYSLREHAEVIGVSESLIRKEAKVGNIPCIPVTKSKIVFHGAALNQHYASRYLKQNSSSLKIEDQSFSSGFPRRKGRLKQCI